MQNRTQIWLACAAALGLPTLTLGQTLEGVQVVSANGGTVVHIKGSGLGQPKAMRLVHGRQYVLHFAGKLKGRATKVGVGKDGLSSISYGWLSARPPRVRVNLRVAKSAHPVLAKDGEGWTVSFGSPLVATHSPTAPEGTTTVATPVFPDSIPPTTPPVTHPTVAVVPQRRVNLECSNTDVVQILKGLALQTGSNIVIQEGVTGKVTANLKSVTIEQALDYVCALTNIRYFNERGTYVVSKLSSFEGIATDRAAQLGQKNEIRIVPIVSHDGDQIKMALRGWFAPTVLKVYTPREAGAIAPAEGGTDSKSAAPAAAGSDLYIMLIGEKKWVDEAEQKAREIDQDILSARDETRKRDELLADATRRQNERTTEERARQNTSDERTQRTYQVQSGKATKLKMVLAGESDFQNVSIIASPEDSQKQILVISGKPATVERTIDLLRQLDTGSAGDELFVYEVKYLDPRSLRESLISQVAGLRATLAPNGVGNTGTYKAGETKSQAGEITASEPGAPKESQGAPAPTATTAATTSSVVSDTNLEMPFKDLEGVAVPMRLLLRGSKSQIEDALKYLQVIDIPQKQVAIELRVMELTKDDSLKAGIDWNVLGGGAVKFLRLNNSQSSPANSIGGNISGNNFTGDITASLDRIANKNNLIARPNLLATDGRQSEIFVGDIVRYVQSITNSQNGVSVTTGEVPVGVRLSVLPRVGAGGNLTLDIRPRISLLKSFTPVPGGGQLPQTSSRFAQSTLNINSGETIAIGGLIQDQDTRGLQGVPILMDLPVLGYLFRRSTTTRTRTEVVIFLTARTLDGPAHSGDAVLPIQNDSRFGGVTKKP